MYARSRKATTESAEEGRGMTFLQSIIDQESETTDDVKSADNRNSFDANRRFADRHGSEKSANERILPAAKNCGDLRLARSLTTGRKPSSSNSSRLSVSSSSLGSSSESNRRLVAPPLQSPYESSHKQRMVTKYRELGRILYEAMQPQKPSVSLPRQGWVLPVESHQTPKHSVQGNLFLRRNYNERSLSAGGRTGENRGYLQSKQEREEIDIISEGSRTITPSVEIVSVVDEIEARFSGTSGGKRVTFNPEATISEPFSGSFARRTTDSLKWNDTSNMQRQEIDVIRRARTDTSLLKVNKSKRNKENELRSSENDEEQTMDRRYSFNEKRNSSLDDQRRTRSVSKTGNRRSPRRRFAKSFDVTDSTVSSSASMRRSRSPRASRRLLASWSCPSLSDSFDQHISLTDHQLRANNSIEIRRWLEQKNRLLRKQRREERRLERMAEREESEKQREKNEHRLEYQEKARQWMKERKRANLMKKRWSRQLKATTSDSNADRKTSKHQTRVNSLNKKKIDASQELERSTLKGKAVSAESDQRLRAESAPSETRQSPRGKSAVRGERARNKERQKRTAYYEWRKVDRDDTKSSVIEDHTENATNDQPEGRKARGRSKATGKSSSKSVQLDSTDSEKMHNKHSKGKISTQSSKDRLDPQGCEFKETSSYGGDAEREVDNSRKELNALKQNGGENSNDDMDKQTLDEENGNEKDYEWKTNQTSESEDDGGSSKTKSLTNERHQRDESYSGVDGDFHQKDDSRVKSRSTKSDSRTSSDSEHNDGASENTNSTNKLRRKKESSSGVDGEFYQKVKSRVESRSSRSNSQESHSASNVSRRLSATEDVDKKKDSYDINDRNDTDFQLHHKRNSPDYTASREYRDQTQESPRNSSPKRRNEEQSSRPESNASDTSGIVHKHKRKEYTEKQKSGSSRHSSQSRVYENTPSTPEASEENFRNQRNHSEERSDKFKRGSDRDNDLQRIASKNSMNSAHNEEQNHLILSSSHAKQNGDRIGSAETRLREETSSRNSKPPSDIVSGRYKNKELDSEDTRQNDDDKDISRRHSIFEEQQTEANQLGDTFTLGHDDVEENLGNRTYRKSAHNENDDFSPFKAETRDLPSRNSPHSKNDKFSPLKAGTRDLPSRNSPHSKNDEFSPIKAETRDIPSRNSPHSQNDKFSPFKAETRDSPLRNSPHSQNDKFSPFKAETRDSPSRNSPHSKDDEFSPLKAETSDIPSRNSPHSKNDEFSPFKAETRDLPSRNSAHSKNDEFSPFKPETRDLPSRNSPHSKDDEFSPFKAETRDLPSRNSPHSQNDKFSSFKAETRDLPSRNFPHSKDDEFSPFKAETRDLPSRNSPHSKDDEFSPLKAETRDIPSRNSAHSKNDEFSHFKAETRDLPSRNSPHSKNDEISPFKAETRDLPSRNSAHSKNDEFSPFKAEARDLPSRNSPHNKNDEFSPFKAEARDLPSRNSPHSKNDDELSSFKVENRKMASRNSAHSKNDENLSLFKTETRDTESRISANSKKYDEFSHFKGETSKMASRNSADSRNGKDLSSFKAENRKLASRNSTHNENDENLSLFKTETRDIDSRNSANSKKHDEFSPFKGETSKMASRNSADSQNDEYLSHLKSETKDILSSNSTKNPNVEDMLSF